jgi:hypothetical protein
MRVPFEVTLRRAAESWGVVTFGGTAADYAVGAVVVEGGQREGEELL